MSDLRNTRLSELRADLAAFEVDLPTLQAHLKRHEEAALRQEPDAERKRSYWRKLVADHMLGIEEIREEIKAREERKVDLPSIAIACPKCHALRPHVDDERGTWHCACGAGGDLFDYVMQRDGVDFADALKHLGGIAGITVDVERRDPN